MARVTSPTARAPWTATSVDNGADWDEILQSAGSAVPRYSKRAHEVKAETPAKIGRAHV